MQNMTQKYCYGYVQSGFGHVYIKTTPEVRKIL